MIDLAGKRFGRLLVVKRASNRPNHGKAMWLCQCDCGNTKIIVGTSLTRKKGTKSCGCIRKEICGNKCHQWKGGQFNEGSEAWANRKLNSIRQVSKKNGYNFHNYTADEFLDWYNSQERCCVICGKESDMLCIDHNHSTGFLRGLLCTGCNYGLGCFQEDSNLLQLAHEYLK